MGAPVRQHAIRRPAGFSLLEVLFAIMILGVGLIMVAAIFPVAIQQARDSHESTTAAEIAKSAAQTVYDRLNGEGAAQAPFTGNRITYAGNHGLFHHAANGLRGSMIYGPDPRYAWTAIYRRGGTVEAPDPYIQLFIFVVNSSDGRYFEADNDLMPALPNLWPRRVEITGVAGAADRALIRDDNGPDARPAARQSVASGTFLVLEDGAVLRAGSLIAVGASADEWQLYPGDDASAYASPIRAWIVGRRLLPGGGFEGTAQDIAVYTTYVRVR